MPNSVINLADSGSLPIESPLFQRVVNTDAAVIVIYAAVNIALIASTNPYVYPIDDAYITLHNAQVLWSGVDPNYNVPALVGATSLVHLFLVAMFLPLYGGLAPAIVGFLGGVTYLIGVRRIGTSFGLSRSQQGLLLVVAAGAGSVFYQLTNGLETGWTLAAVTWAIVLASSQRPSSFLAVICGLLPFVRPELAALSASLLLRQFYLRTKSGYPAAIASDIALAACAFAPWLAWIWIETGAALLGTADAKVAFFAEERLGLLVKLGRATIGVLTGLGPIAIAPFLAKRSSLSVALSAFCCVFFLAFALKFPGGLFHNWNRYTYALLPCCLWALSACRETRPRTFKIALLSLALSAPLTFSLSVYREIEGQAVVRDAFKAAAWTNANIAPDQGLLTHDAGVIAYATKNPLADLVGLKTPGSVAVHMRWTLPSAGRDRAQAIGEIADGSRFHYAMIRRDPEEYWSALADDLRQEGWGLTPVREPSIPVDGYVIFRLAPPSATPPG